ncbi:MAG: hypothetical protein LC798_13640 [Chloroflexi bacterium]|nr:hypothetical protein [Chloroflexota bacterium]
MADRAIDHEGQADEALAERDDDDAAEPEVTAGPPPVRRAPVPAPRHRPMSLVEFLEQNATPEALEANTKLSEAFDKACASLVTENDVVVDKASGRAFKKKSAWKKLGRAFGVSVEIVERRTWYDEDEDGVRHFNAEVVARSVAPWGQYADDIGACSTREEKYLFMGVQCPRCGGPTWDNREPRKGEPGWLSAKRERGELAPFSCRNKQCGEEVWDYSHDEAGGGAKPNPTARAKALHDVTATAATRASNRAISDLIAAGEVSAEEVEGSINRANGAPANDPVTDQAGAEQREAQDAGTDMSLLNAKIGGKSKHADRTWNEMLASDRSYVLYRLGRNADGTPKPDAKGVVRNEKLKAALYAALARQEAKPAPAEDASREPATQAQLDRLDELLDQREWSEKAEWWAWAKLVKTGEQRPSRRGMDEAIARFETLPEKAMTGATVVAQTMEGPDDSGLPF